MTKYTEQRAASKISQKIMEKKKQIISRLNSGYDADYTSKKK